MPGMRIAIIDLGTNSVRFDVHSLGKKEKLLHREKLMIRLGQGVFLKGRMSADAIERAVHAFSHFRAVCDNLQVQKIVAFGTSALREAQDSGSLLEVIRERAGIEVKVISGEEEARLIALGILAHETPPKGRFALVDIGGGSTEISFCRGRKVLHGESYPLGTARLQQVFLKKSPPKTTAVKNLRQYIRNILGQSLGARGWPVAPAVIGSSGTVKALAKILGNKAFSLAQLKDFVADISGMTGAQLLEVPGMEAKRVDMILVGAVLLEEVMIALGAKKVTPTDFSLRDGILEEEHALSKRNSRIELHAEALFARAVRLGQESEHLWHMADFSASLFDRLRAVHRLHPRWKIYLLAAVVLRKCGEAVSYADRAKHSYYIVKHADLPGLEPWEHEFVARLCLHYGAGKPELRALGERRAAFKKLLALLRVIDALDLGPRTALKIGRTRVSGKNVTLTLSGAATAGAEQLMLERKKKLFEEEFKRTLTVERRAR